MLQDLPILRFLPDDVKEFVLASFVTESFDFGSPIVTEGQAADAYFVLVAGRARVVRMAANGEEISLRVLRAGETFGEVALLGHTTRTATVRASTDCEVMRLDKAVFEALLRKNPEARRGLELQYKHRELHNFFRQFTAFTRLPADALAALIGELQVVEVGKGERIVRQGDPPGPMYIIAEGRLRAFVEESGQRKYRRFYRSGDYFGEHSLFKQVPRAVHVEAVSKCRLYRLDPEVFLRLAAEQPIFKAEIEERIAQYDFLQTARVPLDFAEEMLPAEALSSGPETFEGSAADMHPFASDEGHFVRKDRRIRRFPLVRQIDEMDCGPAALAMVCRHFGRAVGLARLRQLVHTAVDGTSLESICRAATELGLAARSVQASARNLEHMPVPAIVHWEGNHWVVLYDIGPTHASIADPGGGLQRLTRAEFEKKWTGFAALFDYTEAFDSAPEGKPAFSWLWPFFRAHAASMYKAVALAIIVSVLQMAIPVLTQVIVDKVLVEQDAELLNTLMLAMLAVLVFISIAMVAQRYLLSFAAVRIDAATLDFLTRKLLALPMRYFNSRRTGDIQRRLESVQRVREFMVQSGVGGMTALAQLVVALLLMFIYSPKLTAVFLATVPLYIVMMAWSARKLRPIMERIESAFAKYFSFQIDAIKGIETVKSLASERAFREMLLSEFHGIAQRRFNADFTIMCYDGAIQAVTFLSIVLFLWVGAYEVMDGNLTIGALVAFNSLVALANGPITVLLLMWDNLQLSTVLLERVNDVLEQEPEQGADHSKLAPVRSVSGQVTFQNMGFRYGGPESVPILEGINLVVPAGRRVAIVGRSGSGKTTLVKCLAGLIEPTEGTILYDGVDMKSVNYRDLRRHIGFVLQENHLFNDTIAKNIAFGEPSPDMDKVVWASRMAHAHGFIEQLPLGYETRVGETGIALSGGQRQRLAIARAVYPQPPILVFDEATSSLDAESERAVKENLEQLQSGRTSFVIAHRLSTVRDADQIIVIEKGRLLEQGSHDELMRQRGLYYYLCSQQLGIE